MSEASDPDIAAPGDGELMARLRDMFQAADPLPAEVVELARQSFTLRTLDAELAALVEDTAGAAVGDDPARAVPVRRAGGGPEPRQLTFQYFDGRTGDELVIAMQVEAVGVRRRLTGHLAPAGPAEIEMRQPAVPQGRRVEVDPLGRFVFEDVYPGPASLTCRRVGAPAVATQWTLL